MSSIVAIHPLILWDALQIIDEWTPAIQALDAGNGTTYWVSPEMAQSVDQLFAEVSAAASPGLSAAIQQERFALDLPSLGGLSVKQVWEEIQTRRTLSELFMPILLK